IDFRPVRVRACPAGFARLPRRPTEGISSDRRARISPVAQASEARTMSESADSSACSLHEWEGLRSELLFAFERAIPGGQADGAYVRRAQIGAVLVRRGW